jgi:hypothetical protein
MIIGGHHIRGDTRLLIIQRPGINYFDLKKSRRVER